MERRTLFALAIAGAASLSMAGCSSPAGSGPITRAIDHAGGRTEVPVDPKRVVVLDLPTMDSIGALGRGDRIVGGDTSRVGSPAFTFPAPISRAGTATNPAFDQIKQTNPDVIFTSPAGLSHLDALNAIAPTVALARNDADPVATLTDQLTKLGMIFQVPDEARRQPERLRESAALLKPITSASGPSLVVEVRGSSVTVLGLNTYPGALVHRVLDVPQAKALRPSETVPVPGAERTVTKPVRVYAIDRDAATGNPSQVKKALAGFTDIVTLDASRWTVGGGIVTSLMMVQDVEKALKP